MNKKELVDIVATETGVTKKEIDRVIAATLDAIAATVASGERVTLVGFGTFEPRDRAGREGRNPRTGEPVEIPATTVPAFSAGKLFKERVACA